MQLNIEWLLSKVPIIQIKNIDNNHVYSLLEKYNMCGSIKVKTVYRILKDAYEKWLLDKNKIILEASSGNTAIALAYLWNLFNIKVQIIMPQTTAPCKKKLIESYGAETIEINWTTDDGIVLRNKMNLENPSKYFLPDQFANYANFEAHYNLTGPYIYDKLGEIDFFVAGLWTSWTLLWAWKYLKEQLPKIKIIWINPTDRIEWMRNFATSKVKIPFYDQYKYLIDEVVDVSFDPCVIHGVQSYLQEWYFVGISSWAILSWTKKYLDWKKWLKGIIVAPDGWDFYLDTLVKYIDLENFIWCK